MESFGEHSRRGGEVVAGGRYEIEIKWKMVSLPKMPSVSHEKDRQSKKREKRKNEKVKDW